MHRLFSIAALIVGSLLIAQGADARPHFRTWDGVRPAADKSTPKLLEGAAKGKVSALRTARTVNIQWRPGLVSRNVRIVRLTPRRSLRSGAQTGEKGGTEDINIGVGELQECTISKSMDAASPLLARLAKTRRRLPSLILTGTDSRGQTFRIKFSDVLISSYQAGGSSGREHVSFTYKKVE